MKNTLLLITTLAATTAISTAGDFTESITDSSSTTIATVPSGESKLSGTLSFDANSHFISYGSDVWGAGTSATEGWTFNPSFSVDYALTDAISLNAGFWADINDNVSGVGFDGQEIDIWLGASYTSGIATYSVTFQSWQYAGASEEVLDLGISLDTFLNPSITLHQRLGAGASGGDEGTFLVAGIEESFTIADKYTFSVPVNVGYSVDDDYHAGFHSTGTTDSGFAYVSIGLQSSIPLTEYSSFNYGVTYYIRDEDVVGDNSGADNFFTYNAGVSLSF